MLQPWKPTVVAFLKEALLCSIVYPVIIIVFCLCQCFQFSTTDTMDGGVSPHLGMGGSQLITMLPQQEEVSVLGGQ